MMSYRGIAQVVFVSLLLSSCAWKDKKPVIVEQPDPYGFGAQPTEVDLEKAARLNIELGLGYLAQGQHPRAKSKFARARHLAPHLPEVHYAYGYFQERTGDIVQAEASYLKAISLHPKGGNEHNSYGAFLCRQHQHRRAEKEFLKAVADSAYMGTALAYENAGTCVLQIPDFEKAREYFEKALKHDPNLQNALLELGLLAYRAGQWEQAKAYHARHVALAKPSPRALLLGIELAKNAGDYNKVASDELLLRSQFPDAKLADLLKVASYDPVFYSTHTHA